MSNADSEIINLLIELSEEEGLELTLSETVKGTAWAGGFALVGGLCAGPAGIAFGEKINKLKACNHV